MASPAPRRQRVLRTLRAFALCLLVPYAVLLTTLYFQQERLIFAGTLSQGQPWGRLAPPPGTELVALTTNHSERITALFGPALTPDGQPVPHPRSCPTLLDFYGNGACVAGAQWEFDFLRRLGANVLMPDYPGYGMSGGSPSEGGCYRAGDAAYEHLLKRREVDPHRIYACGTSLGGAVAIDVASRRPVAGLITLSTFSSMTGMLGRQYPFVPQFLLRHPFDSMLKIRKVRCPILLGHSTGDPFIPYAMADQLAGVVRAPLTRITLHNPGHGDMLSADEPLMRQALSQFIGTTR